MVREDGKKLTKEDIRKRSFPKTQQYPFQNSTWYFDAEIVKNEVENATNYNIKLLKSNKGINKVQFIDDMNCLITVKIGNKIDTFSALYIQPYNSEFEEDSNVINFKLIDQNVSKTTYNKQGIPYKEQPMILLTSKYIEQNKNTLIYYRYFFNNSYHHTIHDNEIILNNEIISNEEYDHPPVEQKY